MSREEELDDGQFSANGVFMHADFYFHLSQYRDLSGLQTTVYGKNRSHSVMHFMHAYALAYVDAMTHARIYF
jgi:hypothetical protein